VLPAPAAFGVRVHPASLPTASPSASRAMRGTQLWQIDQGTVAAHLKTGCRVSSADAALLLESHACTWGSVVNLRETTLRHDKQAREGPLTRPERL
jgi:hypothetical protein